MNVRVYSTTSSLNQTITSNATTKEELRQEVLDSMSVDINNYKAVVGETQVTLESKDAKLPNEDFTLFLVNAKPENGADLNEAELDLVNSDPSTFDYKTARTYLKDLRAFAKESGNESQLDLIGNYTHSSTAELIDRLTDIRENLIEVLAEDDAEDMDEAIQQELSEIKERLLNIEYKLKMKNQYNEKQYNVKELEELTEKEQEIRDNLS